MTIDTQPQPSAPARRPWLRMALAALGGAGVLIGVGQLFAHAGGNCAILCRPWIAGLYGAVLGVLFVGIKRD